MRRSVFATARLLHRPGCDPHVTRLPREQAPLPQPGTETCHYLALLPLLFLALPASRALSSMIRLS